EREANELLAEGDQTKAAAEKLRLKEKAQSLAANAPTSGPAVDNQLQKSVGDGSHQQPGPIAAPATDMAASKPADGPTASKSTTDPKAGDPLAAANLELGPANAPGADAPAATAPLD